MVAETEGVGGRGDVAIVPERCRTGLQGAEVANPTCSKVSGAREAELAEDLYVPGGSASEGRQHLREAPSDSCI